MFSRNKNRIRKATGVILLPFLFCGCTTVSLVIPNPPVDAPELPGQSSAYIGLSIESAPQIELVEDGGHRPPTLGRGEIDRSYLPKGSFEVERGHFLFSPALYLSADSRVGASFKTQYQMIGSSQAESQAGDNSFSTSAELAYLDARANGNQSRLFGPGGYSWKAYGIARSAGIAFSAGRRLSKDWLFYGGIGYVYFDTIGNIHQDTGSDGSADLNLDIPRQQGNTTGYSIGFSTQRSLTTWNIKVSVLDMHYEKEHESRLSFLLGAEIGTNGKSPSPVND